MYLKRLELQGFKSFADKTVLEFMPGITAVIGPNGSGKSNISDAIRWVLGEQSMKSLRGSKSEDIIFAGTQSRKSLGFAEVSIVIDNTDNKLPIEYTEVTVTRRIYRSGETGYFINKVPCRLKDILELFMDTGIGKDGYSIIGQGKIDEILSNKSEDRRHIFEEAAGIVKYRVRKAESEKKLEHAKLNLLRINDILAEIESGLEPLKIQSEKAKKFLDLREELKSIEIGLFLHQIETYQEKIKRIVTDAESMNSSYETAEIQLQEKNSGKEEIKQKLDEITANIESMQNIGFESSKMKEQVYSEIHVAKERISNNRENDKRFETEIEELENKIQELKTEKTQKIEKKTNLFADKEKFAKELAEKERNLAKLTEKLSAKELEMEAKKKKVEQDIDERYELNASLTTKDVNYENMQKRQMQIKTEIASTISDLDKTRLEKEEIAKGFYAIETEKNKYQAALENSNKEREIAQKKLKQYVDEIDKLSYETRMKESRYHFLKETEREKEGYVKSVKSLLVDCEKVKELGKGMHGVLANIIEVPKDYEVAIEMALGYNLQNIVTETEQDAKRLVEHLRTNKLGRASFLPIATVKGNRLDKIKQKGIDGVIGIAADLVNFQKKYEQILFNLLGRTVVVDNMDTAIALAKQNQYSFRIVTLQGDTINPSGSITGGSVQTKTVNILGRSREIESLEKEIKKLRQKIQGKQEEKDSYEENMESVLEEASSIESKLQEIDIQYATEKQKMLAIEENINKLEARRDRLKVEQEQLEKQKQENRQEKEKIEKQIQEKTEEIETLNKVIEEFANLNKDNQKVIDDLNFDITNLKISVSSFDESETSINEMVERIQKDMETSQISIKNKKKQREAIKTEVAKLEENINLLEEKIITIEEDVKNSGTKVEEYKQERTEQNKKLDAIEKEISEQYKTIESLKEQVVKIDVKKAKVEQDLELVINKMWEEYEITPNNAQEYEKPKDVSGTQKRVNLLRGQIRDLGSINIDAIEEYKQSKQRYDFMCEQRLDLENSSTKLKKVISEMTTIMKEQFKEQFQIINRNFNEVFQELFGGGKAELVLTDEENILECGIDIQVQPTGKKLQNMMLLSGGEKALTAIALLFAILKINPAPFCVLDEIEAALDDVNVFRFADYLKHFTSNTQFLVITHRKGTMEAADTVYGITMEENGISKLLSMKLK